MKRRASPLAALLFLAVVLLAGSLALPAVAQGTPTPARVPFVIELPPGAWALVPLDGQAVPDGEWTYDGEGGQYSVSFWQWITPSATATPTPHATDTPSQPPPTATPTATVTSAPTKTPTTPPTPTPTATHTIVASPLPSATPSPTVSATAPHSGMSTPTPESGIPTQPPATSTKPDGQCYAGAGTALKLRSGPGTTYGQIGTVASAERVLVLDVVFVDVGSRTDEWAHVRRTSATGASANQEGYMAILYNNEALADYTDYDACLEVRFPEPETAYGLTVTVGADKATARQMVDIVAGAGREPALVVVMDVSMAAAFNDSAYVIWRPWPDCPSFDATPADSVRTRLDYIDAVTRFDDFDALQISNECIYPSPQYLNLWTLEALKQARLRYPGKTIIPWVFAPGVFEPSWVPALHDALADMAAHGDMAGLNLYPARANVPLSTRDAWTVWTTWRYELIDAVMEPDAMPCWAITEAGAGDGNMALTPADAAAFVRQIDGDVCVVAFWHLSPPGGAWPDANLWDRVSVVFGAVVAALA